MDLNQLKSLLKKSYLENEFDLEMALLFDKKLRLLSKTNSKYISERRRLRVLIVEYELEHWTNTENITEEQIIESDKAEFIVKNING